MDCKSLLFVIISFTAAYFAVQNTIKKGKTAQPGENNIYNNYENISGMKHDFFKLFCNTFITMILFSNLPIVSINIFESILGRALAAGFIIMFYHSTIQPYVNMTTAW
jgi:hypothetical protein